MPSFLDALNTVTFPTVGSTSRSTLARLNDPIFNVKEFGAVANSNSSASTGADQSAAFQAAVYAAAAASGGVVFIPRSANWYRLDHPVLIPSYTGSIMICGEGGGSKIVGNFAGYLFDRYLPNNSGGPIYINDLLLRNYSLSGGCIRTIGTNATLIERCDIQGGVGWMGGGVQSPTSAYFTGLASGTTLTVTNIVGTIDNNSGDAIPLPCPIFSLNSAAVPSGTTIVSQSGAFTGGNGTYTTNQATTCSDATRASFTGTIAGTTLTASSVTGTLLYGQTVFGSGVTPGTFITGVGAGGGAGAYPISTGQTVSVPTAMTTKDQTGTNPNAATVMTSGIRNCSINGLGTYNVTDALSFQSTGVQLSGQMFVSDCHINTCRYAISAYGVGIYIRGCQFETNTEAVVISRQPSGVPGQANVARIDGSSFEGNKVGIRLQYASAVISGVNMQGEVDGGHNSTYGIYFDNAFASIVDCAEIGGQWAGACYYFTGNLNEITLRNCNASVTGGGGSLVAKDSGTNYSFLSIWRCRNFPAISCTLAQLVTYSGLYSLTVGDRFLISDGPAYASQTYAAPAAGGGSILASVWWDGTTFRYG